MQDSSALRDMAMTSKLMIGERVRIVCDAYELRARSTQPQRSEDLSGVSLAVCSFANDPLYHQSGFKRLARYNIVLPRSHRKVFKSSPTEWKLRLDPTGFSVHTVLYDFGDGFWLPYDSSSRFLSCHVDQFHADSPTILFSIGS